MRTFFFCWSFKSFASSNSCPKCLASCAVTLISFSWGMFWRLPFDLADKRSRTFILRIRNTFEPSDNSSRQSRYAWKINSGEKCSWHNIRISRTPKNQFWCNCSKLWNFDTFCVLCSNALKSVLNVRFSDRLRILSLNRLFHTSAEQKVKWS